MTHDPEGQKRRVGEQAADFVEDGTIVGLGTGTTAYYAIQRVGVRIAEGLRVRCVATSVETERLAAQLGIPIESPGAVLHIDLTIDGADQVDADLNAIKGGHGALTREKIVASMSREVIWVVDDRKLSDRLGGPVPVPVEVVQFGWEVARRRLEGLADRVERRVVDGAPLISDNGHFILDCSFHEIADPAALEKELNIVPGVLDNGLFLGMATRVVAATGDEVRVLTRPGT